MVRQLFNILGLVASMLIGGCVAMAPLAPMHPGERMERDEIFAWFFGAVLCGGMLLGAAVWILATKPRRDRD